MSIETLLKEWDGEEVILRHDRPSGTWMIIAIHSSRLGPPSGGTRMKRYPDLAAAVTDAMNLSQGMTFKFAVAGMKRGGGKAVIHLPADFDSEQRPGLLRRYGGLIKQLGGFYETGPDVGTTPEDMDVIAETGAPHVYGRTPAQGGSGNSGYPTAVGVFSAIEAACQHLYNSASLAGRRVLVQGTGSVGGANNQLATAADAQRLHERGILYAPDYAVNIGGAMALLAIESEGVLAAQAYEKVRGVRQTLLHIFQTAAAENISPDAAAQRIAQARLG